MFYKLHHEEEVIQNFVYRYAVPGGWLYVMSKSSFGHQAAFGYGQMVFVPDGSVIIKE